jgi:cysteine desulfurase
MGLGWPCQHVIFGAGGDVTVVAWDGSAYFDTASAAPLHPVARQALAAALDDGWADPGKLYSQARRARQLLEAARATAAEVIGVRAEELTFTPSGTDANRRAVSGLLRGRRRAGSVFVHSAVEHSSILHSAAAHEAAGLPVRVVPVDREGRVWLRPSPPPGPTRPRPP